MNAEATLAADNHLQALKLTSDDGHLKADVTPSDAGYAIKLDAIDWTMPAGPKVLFNHLNAEMSLQGSKLHITSLEAMLYQGALSSNAELDWGKGLRASGKFNTDNISIGDAAQLFSKEKLIRGKLSGAGSFGLESKEAAKAVDHLVLDYKFSVANGVLHGVDLAKAATLMLNTGDKGGDTQFDELSGTLHTVGKTIELKAFKVSSGLLSAHGGVKVLPSRQLDGVVEVELEKGMALPSARAYSGPVWEPRWASKRHPGSINSRGYSASSLANARQRLHDQPARGADIEAHEPLSARAKSGPGRQAHLGLFDHELM